MRRIAVLAIVAALIGSSPLAAQSRWAKAFGTPFWDEGMALALKADGTILVTAETDTRGASTGDACYMGLSSTGQILQRQIVSVNGKWISPRGLAATADGGAVIVGHTGTYNPSQDRSKRDARIIRLDQTGAIRWQAGYGRASDDESLASVVETADGGFAMCGYVTKGNSENSDLWVLRTNKNGKALWQHTYGGPREDFSGTIVATEDGGFAVCAKLELDAMGNWDGWVLRLDAEGETVWQMRYGGAGTEWFTDIITQPDGGFLLVGPTDAGAGSYDAWVVKIDSSGKFLWQKMYGTTKNERFYSIAPVASGGTIACGWTEASGAGEDDAWLARLDASGKILWQKTYGGSSEDRAYAVRELSDGSLVTIGTTESFGAGESDAWVLRVGSSGGIDSSCGTLVAPSRASTRNGTAKATSTSYAAANPSVPKAATSQKQKSFKLVATSICQSPS
ncbi:MAG: hypothetical protein AB1714_23135 [Acidobacteriota bacterium]